MEETRHYHVAIRFLFVIISVLLLCFFSCCRAQADTNLSPGLTCAYFGNSTLLSDSYKSNLNTLLNSLSTNARLHNGFYKSSAGKKPDKVYGLIQCRADISAANCANCTADSITVAHRQCPNSKTAAVFARWCFLRYAEKDFSRDWQDGVTAISDDTVDDAAVVAKGQAFMGELARNVSGEPLMFLAAALDVGEKGKRYGMGQCNRDISRGDCGKCLNGLLVSFVSSVLNKRGWEIYGMGCSLWYHDFQFYSNISNAQFSAGARKSSVGVATIGMIIFSALSAFPVVFSRAIESISSKVLEDLTNESHSLI